MMCQNHTASKYHHHCLRLCPRWEQLNDLPEIMQLLDGRGRNRIPLPLDNGDVRKHHQLEVISVCQTALAIIIPRENLFILAFGFICC